MLVVRDGLTGEILGFHRDGLARMKKPGGRDLEIVACDGVGVQTGRYP
jgi:hypothetical protein